MWRRKNKQTKKVAALFLAGIYQLKNKVLTSYHLPQVVPEKDAQKKKKKKMKQKQKNRRDEKKKKKALARSRYNSI